MVPATLRPSTIGIYMAATALVGCPPDERTTTGDARGIAERARAIDGLTGMRTLETTVDDAAEAVRTRFWARPSTGQLRSAVLAPDDRAGDVTVIGTQTIWNYDASAETVRLLTVTPHADTLCSPDRLDALADRYDTVVAGASTLDGQVVHELTAAPTTETGQAPGTLTVWVDPESGFPIQVEAVYGDAVRTTVRYENVTINPGLSPDRFRFDPPAAATVRTPALDTQVYDQPSALPEGTDLPVPRPTVPDGFAFDTATVATDRAVALRYENGSASLVVRVVRGQGSHSPEDGTAITVDGRSATYHAVGDSKTIRWRVDGTAYTVSGELRDEDIRAVAGSIAC